MEDLTLKTDRGMSIDGNLFGDEGAQTEVEGNCETQIEDCVNQCEPKGIVDQITADCEEKEKNEFSSCFLGIVTDSQALNIDALMACYAYIKDCTSVSEKDYRSYWECVIACDQGKEDCPDE